MGVTLKYLRDRIKLEGVVDELLFPNKRIDDIINRTIANLGEKLVDKTDPTNFITNSIELSNEKIAYFFGYAVKRLPLDDENFPSANKDFLRSLTLEGVVQLGDKRYVTKIVEVSESDLLMSLRNFYFRPGIEETLSSMVCGAILFGDKNISGVNVCYLKRLKFLSDDVDVVEITDESIELLIRTICDGIMKSKGGKNDKV